MAEAVDRVRSGLAPPGTLAAVQMSWSEIVGDVIAERTNVISEKNGLLKVSCREAVWVEELSMRETEILGRLRERFGQAAPSKIRFVREEVS